MATITGTSGNDDFSGTSGNDRFVLNQGGEDSASGLGGDDVFVLTHTFDSGDQLDGGDGYDQLWLRGDYSAGVIFTDTTLTNVERIALGAGYDYSLTTADATVAAGATLTVDGSKLGAANALDFDGSAETDGHFKFVGGAGIDTLTGGALGDTFEMGAALTASDRIDGGGGADKLVLNGDYGTLFSPRSTFVLGPQTITNIATLAFADSAAHNYVIQENDANLAAGHTMTVDGRGLNPGSVFEFDGSAETDGNFHFIAGGQNFLAYGGSGNDVFDGGVDLGMEEFGGGGNDIFKLGPYLIPEDQINGGAGNDTVYLDGDYTQRDNDFFGSDTLLSVETLVLGRGYDYKFTPDDATVAAGATMTVNASALRGSDTLTWEGDDRDGSYILLGGAGADVLTGGEQADTIRGGDGADTLTGNSGANIFVYGSAGESNYHAVDRIIDFDPAFDVFQFPFAVDTVSSVTATVDDLRGSLVRAIGTDMAAHGAIVVTADAGALAGHVYLVVDANGNAAYTPGYDFVIDISPPGVVKEILTTANFIT
jgi:hypothetical protein